MYVTYNWLPQHVSQLCYQGNTAVGTKHSYVLHVIIDYVDCIPPISFTIQPHLISLPGKLISLPRIAQVCPHTNLLTQTEEAMVWVFTSDKSL